MTGEKLKEFLRRLTAEGYELDLDKSGAGRVHDGDQSVAVMDDGEVWYKEKFRGLADRVRDIYDEVQEYMAAFEQAAPDTPPRGADRNDFEGRGISIETRTLMIYNGAEFSMRYNKNDGADFITWQIDGNNEREIGHYHDDYAAAKEDFALRCGLIDRRKLFSETELKLIRSGLAEIGDITPDRGVAEMTAIRSLVEKIDDLVIPELAAREQDAEDQGFEPEIDL
jgi:hypothetical protein